MGSGNERREAREASSTLACPQCEGTVETIIHNDVFEYGVGDSSVQIAVDLPVRRCTSCEIEFLDHVAERLKHEALCRHFGVLTPWEIREIRRRCRLSRAAFSELTGLGEATLGRWESGALIQTLANDRYLRLLAEPGGIERLRIIRQQVYGYKDRAVGKPGRSHRRFPCLVITEELRTEGRAFELFRDAA